ncbi:uncharacterized protein LOC127544969 [Antechinus flavipes]|uniref:uncharacterized protein LOC127544969 n=1 Tax=Antechinus flavipes TaxID=38775 RepID=UPI00223635E5|nr:uncharacterized protein LOC127544969 [Antechinus flavipes]
MNASPASGTGSRSEGNNARPFFYAQPTAQPPLPNPWYLNPAYSPYCVSAAGFRNGNPYIPYYSVALHEYPGFFLPQAPVPTRVNRRPYFHSQSSFPMFQHAAHFCHYSNPSKKTETKETQTDPPQLENKSKKQQNSKSDVNGCNVGSLTGRVINVASGKKAAVLSSFVQERGVHSKSPSKNTAYRSISPGNYALEKEEVRIEYGDGSPAIQLWKSFKETIPLYDLTHGQTVPQKIVQCDLFSVSSCERVGVLYTPHREEKMPTVDYSEEDKQYLEAVQGKEIKMSGPSLEGNLDKNKESVATQKCSVPLDTTNPWQSDELNRSGKKVSLMASPSLSVLRTLNRSTQELNQQARSVCSNRETINGLSQEAHIPNRHHGRTKLRDGFWSNESDRFVSSPTWLARFEKIDASLHSLPQRKSLNVSSTYPSSRNEVSSLDNVPMTDFVLEKNTYLKSRKGTEQEAEIQADHCNEKGAVMMVGEIDGVVVHDTKENPSGKIKGPIKRGREQEALPSYPTWKTCLLKKKECLSDPDSEDLREIEDEDDVGYDKNLNEVEYIFEAVDPQEDLTPSNRGFYQEIGQEVIWKPPRTTTLSQLIVWPVKNKVKTKSGGYESTAFLHKLKNKDYYETACGKLLKKRMVIKRRVKLDRLKRKILRKCKNIRPEAETVEVWTVPRYSIHRGYGSKKSSYRK